MPRSNSSNEGVASGRPARSVVAASAEPRLLLPSETSIRTWGSACGVRVIGQVAKLLAARAEVRLTRAFGSGTVRQGSRGCRSQSARKADET